MKMEHRVRYFLRAASRAEMIGDHRAARNLRRMADEIRPLSGQPRGVLRE